VKRVKKYLAAIETRAAGPIDLRHPSRNVVQQVRDGVRSAARHEEILLKGTGRAVEKVLRLAVWFQGEEGRDEGVNVVVRTSSVGAVDDVVVKKGEEEEEVEEDETRIRRVSCLEVGISLR
jgi:ribonuclease P/MRP protein subunit POP7